MPNTRRNFIKGRMNLDVDSRLLEDGEYREAHQIEVVNSEGDNVGSVENVLSNKKLTSIPLGINVTEIGKYEDETYDKLYWWTKSELGCFLIEWDQVNQVASIVLADTRTEDVDRVLNLKETHLITGAQKIITDDPKKDLLLWTDDNMEVCCINVERSKTWGENKFSKEDIYLIKKPPRYAPTATPTYANDGSNSLEDQFTTFFYQYKYMDGEYSALSDPTNYDFTPQPFDLDYFTLENNGMINTFNAVKVGFNTGDVQVTDIRLCAKFSNSNNIYIIDTFNKEQKGWIDNDDTVSHIFSNNNLYTVLAEKELYRSFDNIPTKAKALTAIENIISLGNYEEGMDLIDKDGNTIKVDYDVSVVSTELDAVFDFDNTVLTNTFTFENPSSEDLNIGKQIYFYFDILLNSLLVYSNSFIFIIEEEYDDLEALVSSDSFTNFVDIINNDYTTNYNAEGTYEIDPNYALNTETSISFSLVGSVPTFTVQPVVYTDAANGDAIVTVDTEFDISTYAGIQSQNNATSCKSNMPYEAGIEYQDEFNRRIPIVTSDRNTIFVPINLSIFKNQLQVIINSAPPKEADRFKICIKAKPLQYQTIYVNEYYNEDNHVWCKLVAENKDKVSIGDELIIKKAGEQELSEVIKVKVLDIEDKGKDFIENNTDANENDIIETAGIYMKIRPNGFSMDLDDFRIYQNSVGDVSAGNNNKPIAYLDLFTNYDESDSNPLSELHINQGSSIYIFVNSSRKYSYGWRNRRFEKTFFAQRDYETLEEWFNENLLNGNSIPAITIETGDIDGDYLGDLELVRGQATSDSILIEDPNGKLYLKVRGLLEGSASRKGRCRAEIIIRNSEGFYAFETNPTQAESEVFYQSEQCFDIVDGNHLGNTQDQDIDTQTPAIIDCNFFNCYSQGNGVESYKYKDGFNTNYLNIDLRPSTTSLERPRKIRRFADIIYGQPYVESSGYNGINEFNASTANFKELDKQYGSIQRLFSRDRDLLVFQEEKDSYVLFGRDLLTMADGGAVLSSTPEILGEQVLYKGRNGIGLNPESLAWDNEGRFYHVNSNIGTPIRLSLDGTSKINYGLISHFRKLFIENGNAIKVGGYDPYNNKYILSVGENTEKDFNLYCSGRIYKIISEPFSYIFNLNELDGESIISYNITDGNVTIEAEYDGNTHVASNVTGIGSLTIPRTDLNLKTIECTITPITATATIEIAHSCPVGTEMNLFRIVLNDPESEGETVTNRYRYGNSPFYEYVDVFEASGITVFKKETGIEGLGKFPKHDDLVNIQSFKDKTSTVLFDSAKANTLSFLVSETEYEKGDLATVISAATPISISESQLGINSLINQGTFKFNRPSDISNLYLIWDYRDNS